MMSRNKKLLEKQQSRNKNNMFRLKLEHENIPIIDQKINGEKNLDSVWAELKKKFRGFK